MVSCIDGYIRRLYIYVFNKYEMLHFPISERTQITSKVAEILVRNTICLKMMTLQTDLVFPCYHEFAL